MSQHLNSDQTTLNRRDFFRLNLYQINVTFTVLGDPVEDIPPKAYHAIIRDISGGGISFYTKEPLIYTPDDILTVTFEMLNFVFHQQVPIVRYNQENQQYYLYACQFTNINPSEQDKLISTVFRLQVNSNK